MQDNNCHTQLSLLPGFSQEEAKTRKKKKNKAPNNINCHVPEEKVLPPSFQSNEFWIENIQLKSEDLARSDTVFPATKIPADRPSRYFACNCRAAFALFFL